MGPWSDLFPAGVILFLLLTGKHPFDLADGWGRVLWERQPARKLADIRPDLKQYPALQRVLDQLLDHDSQRRLKSVAEVREALDGVGRARDGIVRRVNPADGLMYVWIPPGSFQMGCSADDTECAPNETPPHDVTIADGFWLGQTPVTQRAWKRVMGTDPFRVKGDDLPAEGIKWEDAVKYGEVIGGRLPTEAQWEYAARGGNPNFRYGELDRIAWYEGNSGTARPVATKEGNAFGLHDMLGNVWEWVRDWYDAHYYAVSERVDPT